MGLLSGLLFFPVVGPVQGIRFVVEQIQAAAEDTMLDEDKITAEITELEMRHELGEISDEEYEAQENELLENLNDIRSQQQQEPEDEFQDLDGNVE